MYIPLKNAVKHLTEELGTSRAVIALSENQKRLDIGDVNGVTMLDGSELSRLIKELKGKNPKQFSKEIVQAENLEQFKSRIKEISAASGLAITDEAIERAFNAQF